jgi:hypothetical protein
VQTFLTKTSSHTRKPCFNAERNFAILHGDAHMLHVSIYMLRRSKYGTLNRKPVASAFVDLAQFLKDGDGGPNTGPKGNELVTLPLVDFKAASSMMLSDSEAVKAMQEDRNVGSVDLQVWLLDFTCAGLACNARKSLLSL